jgi:hypothetical protein
MPKDLIEFLEIFTDTIQVTILEDNKYHIGDFTILQDNLIDDLKSKNVSYQGFSEREFYIVKENIEFTLQVSDFELDRTLDF